jgi:DNA repair photolyase
LKIIYEPKGRAGEYAPLAANLYKGCAHGCKYCYVPSAMHRTKDDFHATVEPRAEVLTNLQVDLKEMYAKGDHRPVFFSFATDPYQPINDKFHLTREAIIMAHKWEVPVMILTKAGQAAMQDFDCLGPTDWFGVTLTCNNADDSKKWEPNAPSTRGRVDALWQAHLFGIKTWVSIEPVLKPESSLEMIREVSRFVDLFKVGKLNHMPEIEKRIDWRKFGRDAEALLKSLGKEYVIKEDLRKCMA